MPRPLQTQKNLWNSTSPTNASKTCKRAKPRLGGIFDYPLKAERLEEVERELERPPSGTIPKKRPNSARNAPRWQASSTASMKSARACRTPLTLSNWPKPKTTKRHGSTGCNKQRTWLTNTSPLTVDKRMPQARIITDAIPPGFFRVQKKPQLRGSFIAVVNYNG